jgi:hypothetical protein
MNTNSATSQMKPTFLEKFAKIYKYPYGNSFIQKPNEYILETDTFERFVQKKRTLRPFHVECRVTKRRLCYCNSYPGQNNTGNLQEMKQIEVKMQ